MGHVNDYCPNIVTSFSGKRPRLGRNAGRVDCHVHLMFPTRPVVCNMKQTRKCAAPGNAAVLSQHSMTFYETWRNMCKYILFNVGGIAEHAHISIPVHFATSCKLIDSTIGLSARNGWPQTDGIYPSIHLSIHSILPSFLPSFLP